MADPFELHFFNTETGDDVRELLLDIRALANESQETVAGLNREINELEKEVHNLTRAHDREAERLNAFIAFASTASYGARERVKFKRGSLLPLLTPYWLQRRRPGAWAVERMPPSTIRLNLKRGSLLPLARPYTKPKPESH